MNGSGYHKSMSVLYALLEKLKEEFFSISTSPISASRVAK